MKFSPNYTLRVLQEEEFSEKMPVIAQQLEECRHEGTFAGFDGQSLYYEYYQSAESHSAIVVVHGLSEFTKKYQEFAWYMLNQGYDVYLYDQRCHGHSCRLTDHPELIHVDHFSDYHKDLHCFLRDVVLKTTDLPLYLYAHSMGGAVAVQYLALYPQLFQKALLAAPMIDPITTGVPPIVARVGLSACLMFGRHQKEKFWGSSEFDPNHPFEKAQDTSLVRFRRNMDFRLADPCYRTTPLSFRWVQQSVMQYGKITRKRFLKKIHTPILMISAEVDRLVSDKAQVKFARKCPDCRRIIIPDSTHALHCCTSDVLTVYMQQVLSYFRGDSC